MDECTVSDERRAAVCASAQSTTEWTNVLYPTSEGLLCVPALKVRLNGRMYCIRREKGCCVCQRSKGLTETSKRKWGNWSYKITSSDEGLTKYNARHKKARNRPCPTVQYGKMMQKQRNRVREGSYNFCEPTIFGNETGFNGARDADGIAPASELTPWTAVGLLVHRSYEGLENSHGAQPGVDGQPGSWGDARKHARHLSAGRRKHDTAGRLAEGMASACVCRAQRCFDYAQPINIARTQPRREAIYFFFFYTSREIVYGATLSVAAVVRGTAGEGVAISQYKELTGNTVQKHGVFIGTEHCFSARAENFFLYFIGWKVAVTTCKFRANSMSLDVRGATPLYGHWMPSPLKELQTCAGVFSRSLAALLMQACPFADWAIASCGRTPLDRLPFKGIVSEYKKRGRYAGDSNTARLASPSLLRARRWFSISTAQQLRIRFDGFLGREKVEIFRRCLKQRRGSTHFELRRQFLTRVSATGFHKQTWQVRLVFHEFACVGSFRELLPPPGTSTSLRRGGCTTCNQLSSCAQLVVCYTGAARCFLYAVGMCVWGGGGEVWSGGSEPGKEDLLGRQRHEADARREGTGVRLSRAVSLRVCHKGDPGSIPGRVTPDLHTWESCGSSRGSPVYPAPSFWRYSMLTSITLIVSDDLDVKSRSNLFAHFTHSPVNLSNYEYPPIPTFRNLTITLFSVPRLGVPVNNVRACALLQTKTFQEGTFTHVHSHSCLPKHVSETSAAATNHNRSVCLVGGKLLFTVIEGLKEGNAVTETFWDRRSGTKPNLTFRAPPSPALCFIGALFSQDTAWNGRSNKCRSGLVLLLKLPKQPLLNRKLPKLSTYSNAGRTCPHAEKASGHTSWRIVSFRDVASRHLGSSSGHLRQLLAPSVTQSGEGCGRTKESWPTHWWPRYIHSLAAPPIPLLSSAVEWHAPSRSLSYCHPATPSCHANLAVITIWNISISAPGYTGLWSRKWGKKVSLRVGEEAVVDHVRIALDDAAGRRVFLGDLPSRSHSAAALYLPHFTFIDSEDSRLFSNSGTRPAGGGGGELSLNHESGLRREAQTDEARDNVQSYMSCSTLSIGAVDGAHQRRRPLRLVYALEGVRLRSRRQRKVVISPKRELLSSTVAAASAHFAVLEPDGAVVLLTPTDLTSLPRFIPPPPPASIPFKHSSASSPLAFFQSVWLSAPVNTRHYHTPPSPQQQGKTASTLLTDSPHFGIPTLKRVFLMRVKPCKSLNRACMKWVFFTYINTLEARLVGKRVVTITSQVRTRKAGMRPTVGIKTILADNGDSVATAESAVIYRMDTTAEGRSVSRGRSSWDGGHRAGRPHLFDFVSNVGMRVQRGEYGAVPERKGKGKREIPEKNPRNQRHHPARAGSLTANPPRPRRPVKKKLVEEWAHCYTIKPHACQYAKTLNDTYKRQVDMLPRHILQFPVTIQSIQEVLKPPLTAHPLPPPHHWTSLSTRIRDHVTRYCLLRWAQRRLRVVSGLISEFKCCNYVIFWHALYFRRACFLQPASNALYALSKRVRRRCRKFRKSDKPQGILSTYWTPMTYERRRSCTTLLRSTTHFPNGCFACINRGGRCQQLRFGQGTPVLVTATFRSLSAHTSIRLFHSEGTTSKYANIPKYYLNSHLIRIVSDHAIGKNKAVQYWKIESAFFAARIGPLPPFIHLHLRHEDWLFSTQLCNNAGSSQLYVPPCVASCMPQRRTELARSSTDVFFAANTIPFAFVMRNLSCTRVRESADSRRCFINFNFTEALDLVALCCMLQWLSRTAPRTCMRHGVGMGADARGEMSTTYHQEERGRVIKSGRRRVKKEEGRGVERRGNRRIVWKRRDEQFSRSGGKEGMKRGGLRRSGPHPRWCRVSRGAGATQKQSSGARKTAYDRVKRRRERKINIEAPERELMRCDALRRAVANQDAADSVAARQASSALRNIFVMRLSAIGCDGEEKEELLRIKISICLCF
ncbi:hypothetical protein PR048_032314 [Dryococelus australis]|uniref:Uncharacterized protein n=1 Tax=Dryococelus australis TaxID=614101 RepID=A0ABQ9G4Q2_9NEOP|nr:hypothetical protein PR048_032314 [Dryococelus australis]